MSIGKQQNTAGLRRFCAAVFYGGAGEITGPDTGLRGGGLRPGNQVRGREAPGPATGKKQDPGGEAGRRNHRDFIDRKPLSC